MTRQASPRADSDDVADDVVPGWQKASVDRSLRNARARAKERSDRFVAVAIDLLSERDETDFTIQDVVDRSAMSHRTFYTFFDTKDSLLLAVYETILRTRAVPILRERCERQSDPVFRLKALTEAMAEVTEIPARVSRALSVLHLRLAESRPNELAQALDPLHSFIVELLTGVADAAQLRTDVALPNLAGLLQELLVASAHSAVLSEGRKVNADDLWAFCSAAILRRPD
jgi:AcrR family transcriptional regulator